MPILNRPPINTSNNDDHYETLEERQAKADTNYDTLRNYNSFPIGSTVEVQREDGDAWTHNPLIDKRDHKL